MHIHIYIYIYIYIYICVRVRVCVLELMVEPFSPRRRGAVRGTLYPRDRLAFFLNVVKFLTLKVINVVVGVKGWSSGRRFEIYLKCVFKVY